MIKRKKSPHRKTEVLWAFSPRVRLWSDRRRDLHIAGEPEGLNSILSAVCLLSMAYVDQRTLSLVWGKIPPGRNPVKDRGATTAFRKIIVAGNAADTGVIRVTARTTVLRLSIGRSSIPSLGFSLYLASTGEGDFSIPVEWPDRVSRQLWFWGYANPHGTNGF